MESSSLLLIVLGVPFLAAVVAPGAYAFFGRQKAVIVPFLAAALPLASLVLLYKNIVAAGQPISVSFLWVNSLNLNLSFLLDGFGVLFAILVSGIGLLIVLYAHHYMAEEPGVGRFFGSLVFFLGAMLGVCLSDHLFSLFLFWELTSISSYLLIGFWYTKKKSNEGALKALLITSVGGLFMMAGFILLGAKTSLWTFSQLAAVGPAIILEPWAGWALVLILIGAFTKSAQFPFHIWLPDAMEAPTPVSAFLHSATMVKAGIILIFRIFPIFSSHPLWFPILATVGMTTVLVGAVLALKHIDLKAILAYSTISQLGLFVTMLGFAKYEPLIYTGLIFHIYVHAFYKGSLFMLTGIIDHGTHTRNITLLGELKKYMPITALFVGLAACSLAGLPPFLGFISKESAIEGTLHIADVLGGLAILHPLVLVLSASLTIAVAFKIAIGVFFSKAANGDHLKNHPPHEASWGFLLAPAVLAVSGFFFGIFPGLLRSFLYPQGLIGSPELDAPHFSLWHGFNTPLALSGLAVSAGVIIFSYRASIQQMHEKLKLSWNLNTVYENLWIWILKAANSFTQFFQNGALTSYVGVTIGFTSLLLIGALITKPDWTVLSFIVSPVMPLDLAVSTGVIIASFLVVNLKDKIARLVSLGTTGILICVFFILRGAPDLALTGFLVEIVMFVLILIIFKKLPEEVHRPATSLSRWSCIIISTLAGLSMGALTLAALTFPMAASISDYFLASSQVLAGGLNVVNVVVVDFRGFDTMGEITVLCLAGMGVFGLRKIWGTPMTEIPRESPLESEAGRLPLSEILTTVSAIILPISVLFSFYMVMRGHNNPGGGFIGGLITASALVLELIALGHNRFLKLFPVNGRKLYAVGLALSFLTGLTPLFFGYPFLTSYVLKQIHFSTASIFDLGVYFVVVGVTIEMILKIEESRRVKAK